jgi:hypothetical protein
VDDAVAAAERRDGFRPQKAVGIRNHADGFRHFLIKFRSVEIPPGRPSLK